MTSKIPRKAQTSQRAPGKFSKVVQSVKRFARKFWKSAPPAGNDKDLPTTSSTLTAPELVSAQDPSSPAITKHTQSTTSKNAERGSEMQVSSPQLESPHLTKGTQRGSSAGIGAFAIPVGAQDI